MSETRRTPANRLDRPRVPSVERRLADLWSELLGVPVDDPDADFFELGGHSLLVVQLFTALERLFERACDAQAFLREPKLRNLTRLVLDDSAASWNAPLLEMAPGQPGVRPLFLAPTVGGRCLDYAQLVDALHPDLPVHGLQAPELLDRETEAFDAATMAARYVEHMRGVQPRGPYAVAGYSTGGVLSLAIAEALHEAGESVAFVGLIDATPPSTVPIPSPFTSPVRLARLARTACGRAREVLRGENPLRRLAVRSASAAVRGLHKWFPSLGHHRDDVRELFQDADGELTATEAEFMQAHLNAAMEFEPRRLPLDLVLLRTALDPFEGPHEPDLGWSRTVTGHVTVATVAGRHHELLQDRATELARAPRQFPSPREGSSSPRTRAAKPEGSEPATTNRWGRPRRSRCLASRHRRGFRHRVSNTRSRQFCASAAHAHALRLPMARECMDS